MNKKAKKDISQFLNLIPVPQLAKANPQISSSVLMSMLKYKSPSNDGLAKNFMRLSMEMVKILFNQVSSQHLIKAK